MKKTSFFWKISSQDTDKKLLTFLKEKLKISNKQIKKSLDKGQCLLNNKIERFGSVTLKKSDEIKFHYNQELLTTKQINKIKILYEDEFFLAIEKPINFESSDQNIHKFFEKNYTLIHRLDKETSGVLLIAKSQEFKQKMINLFSQKKVRKIYLAEIDGILYEKEMTIESYLKKFKVIQGQTLYKPEYKPDPKGKYALTYLKVLKKYKKSTLVELEPVTGRTHQLRVHMKQISHPILGDLLYCKKFYCNKPISRLMLHCLKIEFVHPVSLENIEIFSEGPF